MILRYVSYEDHHFGVYPVFRPKHPETFDDLKRMSQVGFDDKQLRYRVKLHSDGTIKVVAKKNMKVLTYQDIFPHAPSLAPSASAGPDSCHPDSWSCVELYCQSILELFLGREFPWNFHGHPHVYCLFFHGQFHGFHPRSCWPATCGADLHWFPVVSHGFPQGPSISISSSTAPLGPSLGWPMGHRIC